MQTVFSVGWRTLSETVRCATVIAVSQMIRVYFLLLQVALLIDQADQYDEACNAALKGIRAEPQQPELTNLRQALAAADKVVLLVEAQDVSDATRSSVSFIQVTSLCNTRSVRAGPVQLRAALLHSGCQIPESVSLPVDCWVAVVLLVEYLGSCIFEVHPWQEI